MSPSTAPFFRPFGFEGDAYFKIGAAAHFFTVLTKSLIRYTSEPCRSLTRDAGRASLAQVFWRGNVAGRRTSPILHWQSSVSSAGSDFCLALRKSGEVGINFELFAKSPWVRVAAPSSSWVNSIPTCTQDFSCAFYFRVRAKKLRVRAKKRRVRDVISGSPQPEISSNRVAIAPTAPPTLRKVKYGHGSKGDTSNLRFTFASGFPEFTKYFRKEG